MAVSGLSVYTSACSRRYNRFNKLWLKVLRSYAADAAESAENANRKHSTVTTRMAKEFLAQATGGKSKAENRSDVGTMQRLESKEARTFMLMMDGLRRVPGSDSGGFGRAYMGA